MEQQMYKNGWCKFCKRTSKHISDATGLKIWVCTNPKCSQWRTSNMKKEALAPQPLNNPLGYL